MSIFGKITNAIFGTHADATTLQPASDAHQTQIRPVIATTAPSHSAAAASTVDVASVMDKAAAAKGERLEWKTSIVDMLKALDIDSSLQARKDLAQELGYSGNLNDSKSMNTWLHKQVMANLASHGGKLPAELHG